MSRAALGWPSPRLMSGNWKQWWRPRRSTGGHSPWPRSAGPYPIAHLEREFANLLKDIVFRILQNRGFGVLACAMVPFPW